MTPQDRTAAAARYGLRFIVHYVPPRNRGLRLVALLDRVLPPSATLFRARIAAGVYVTCDLRDSVQACIFYRGVYEPSLTRMILDELGLGDVFLDLGANIGYFSLLASRKVGPMGSVHAFEPSPDLSRRLKSDARRLATECAKVTVHEVATFDRSATVVLKSPESAASAAGETFIEVSTDTDEDGVHAEAVRVDDYLPMHQRVDVVKIDVEGAELRALRGMTETILRCRPRLIVVETIDQNLRRFDDDAESLMSFMGDLGYTGEPVVEKYWAPMTAFRPS